MRKLREKEELVWQGNGVCGVWIGEAGKGLGGGVIFSYGLCETWVVSSGRGRWADDLENIVGDVSEY